MNWTDTAILSAAVFATVHILDSHLISRRMPNLQVFLLLKSAFFLVSSIVLFSLFPLPTDVSIWIILAGLASTLIRLTGIAFILYTMAKEDVSQVVPVAFTYPVFVAIIASALMGETLYFFQWLAVIIVVSGAIMVSVKKSSTGSTTVLSKNFLLLFGVSILLALGDIGSKFALAYLSPMNMFAFFTFSGFAIFTIVSLRPHVIRKLVKIKLQRSTIALFFLNETLTPLGMILMLLAIEKGPISLVSTLLGSRPIFVMIFSLILGWLIPKFLIRSSGKGLLALRLVATAMIVAGISIIYLN